MRLTFTLPALLLSAVSASHAALIAGWDFQGTAVPGGVGTSASAAPGSPLVYTANDGLQEAGSASVATIYLDGTNGSSAWTSLNAGTPEVTAFGGTNLNTSGTQLSTTTSGASSLALANLSAVGKNLMIRFDLSGYQDPVLTFASRRSGTGFTGNQWAWSTDGNTFTDFGAPVVPVTDAFGVVTLDLSGVDALDNAATVYFRYTLVGATTTTGNNRLDNIQINANVVPEPGVMSFALCAMAALGLRRKRR